MWTDTRPVNTFLCDVPSTASEMQFCHDCQCRKDHAAMQYRRFQQRAKTSLMLISLFDRQCNRWPIDHATRLSLP